jgi:hypothetical protein
MSKDRSSRLLKGLQDYLSVQFVPREVGPGWTGEGARRGNRERAPSTLALYQASFDFKQDLFALEEPEPKRPRLDPEQEQPESDSEDTHMQRRRQW